MDDQVRALSALHALDSSCDRETWVRIAMAAKAAGITLDDFTKWSSSASNFLSERDCANVWRSIDESGRVTASTLFALAFEGGWEDPAGKYRKSPRHITSAVKASRPRDRNGDGGGKGVESVRALWDACLAATEAHPYVEAKSGVADGLRVVPSDHALVIAGYSVAGWLAVPARSLSGELRTVQLIPPPGEGRKLNMPGASFDDGMFVLGDLAAATRIFIVEGIGQAWACSQATGAPSVVTFGAARMLHVARLLERRVGGPRLVLVPDRDKEALAESIARELGAEWVTLPEQKPSNYDAWDYGAECGRAALASLLEQPHAPVLRYKILRAQDLAAMPRLAWLVRGVLPATGLASIYGVSASGKSFLTLDMCAAIASGSVWFGRRVTPVPVVYIALEGEQGFCRRVSAWERHHQRAFPESMVFIMQPTDLRSPADVRDLADAVRASGCAGGLLVIDTLNRAASGADENSSADMGALIDAAKALQSMLSGLVLLVHHAGKDPSKGLRGHSSLTAALDAAIEVSRSDTRREWSIAKAKDDADDLRHAFRLEVIELGMEDDGEPITSCVVVQDDSDELERRPNLPRGGNQRIAWDVLGDLLKASNRYGMNGAPPSRPCVELEGAVQAIASRLTCETKRRSERAWAAITGLVARGPVVCRDGWLWLP